MMKLDDIEEVKDEENVARVLFSPYFFKKNGSLSTAAFNLRNLKSGPEKYVSVERLSLVPMSDFVAFAKTLTPPFANKLYGYATLKSGDIRSLLPYVDIKRSILPVHICRMEALNIFWTAQNVCQEKCLILFSYLLFRIYAKCVFVQK